MIVHLDFETRSLVDLTETATSRYAEDPSTEILCLAVKVDNEPTKWWIPKSVETRIDLLFGDLFPLKISSSELSAIISKADMLYAHNSSFERILWHHVMHKRYGFDAIPLSKWRCTAAMAAMHNLPRSLDGATTVLKLDQKKDKAGRALMLKMTNPLPPVKAAHVALAAKLGITYDECKALYSSKAMKARWYSDPYDKDLIRWHDLPEAYLNLIRYCIQDVEAEHALTKRLKPLPKAEQEVFELDAVINERGIPVDLEAVKAFIELTKGAQLEADAAFLEATGGAVDSPKCYVAFAEWLRGRGVPCDGVGAGAIEELLERGNLPSDAREALEIAQAANKSSVAKYDALLRGASFDGRIRDTMLYHGAGTGRWAGKLFQPQNLPRGNFSDVDACIAVILSGDFGLAELMWGSPMAAASTCIRGMIKASPGHDLLAADFSAIEGRVLAWLADEQAELDLYLEGKCVYCAAAAIATGLSYEEIYSGYKAGIPEYKTLRNLVGKVLVLAFGYGGGKGAAAKFAPDMPAQEAESLKKIWRANHPKTVAFWYDLTDAAAGAVRYPGRVYTAGRISFLYREEYGFLMMKLPSGRLLYYAFPEVHREWIGTKVAARKAKAVPGTTWTFAGITLWFADGKIHGREEGLPDWECDFDDPKLWEKEVWKVQAWVVDSKTKKWVKRDLSHLVLSENATQAVARDLIVNGIRNVEPKGYPVIFHVHDEAVAEVPEGFGNVKEFEGLLCELPPWAEGLPIKAEGWRAKRFKK